MDSVVPGLIACGAAVPMLAGAWEWCRVEEEKIRKCLADLLFVW